MGRLPRSCHNRAARGARSTRTGEDPGARPGRRTERTDQRKQSPHDCRNVHLGDQDRPRPDAQGRRHHGRRHARSGQDRRGCRRGRRHGARTRPGRHPRGRWRRSHERPIDDRGDHGRGDDPGHGEGPHRPLRRGPGPRGARRRLHRRVRGPHTRRTSTTTSTSTPSRSRSCAAAGTWARPCAGSTRVPR